MWLISYFLQMKNWGRSQVNFSKVLMGTGLKFRTIYL